MNSLSPIQWIVASIGLALLPGCGGGTSTVGGGIGGTGKPTVTVGTVTQVGTLKVAGSTFTTSGALVTISGQPATPAQLAVGMTARVEGRLFTSTHAAEHVVVEEAVKGPLTAKPASGVLTVLGQTVEVGLTTTYGPGISPASEDGLAISDLLEVYGYLREPGVIVATRIEREGSLSEFRVLGVVAGHDPGSQTFQLGALTVDYSSADTDDLPGDLPSDGMLLLARGLNALSTGGELVATELKTDDLDDFDDNDETEVEGFVTAILSPTQFVVSGVTVTTSPTTRYEGGTAADLLVGVKVSVEGALEGGVLLASEVEFEESVHIEADVATVGASSFTLHALPGLIVQVDAQTEFEDATGLGDLAGAHVEVKGRKIGPNTVLATEVEVESPDSRVELQGPVDASPAPADPVFAILGVLIDTSIVSDGSFEGDDDAVVGRAAFFAALSAGTLVKAEGDRVADAVAWDEMELEGDDD